MPPWGSRATPSARPSGCSATSGSWCTSSTAACSSASSPSTTSATSTSCAASSSAGPSAARPSASRPTRRTPIAGPPWSSPPATAVEEGEAAADEGRWVDVGTANMHFHQAIAALAESPRVAEAMGHLLAELRLVFHVMAAPQAFHEAYLPDNRRILEMLDGRRPRRRPRRPWRPTSTPPSPSSSRPTPRADRDPAPRPRGAAHAGRPSAARRAAGASPPPPRR